MIAACDAPDGSHWALQQWQRLWKNYGGDRAPNELYISHWRGGVGELRIADRLQLPRQAPAPVGQVHVPRQARLRHEVDAAGRAARPAGPQHLRRLPDRPDVAAGEQLPDPSAHRGLLLHVRQPPGLDAGLERPGHGQRLSRHGDRARASRRSCRRTSRRPARTRRPATTPRTPRRRNCSTATRAAASTSAQPSCWARRASRRLRDDCTRRNSRRASLVALGGRTPRLEARCARERTQPEHCSQRRRPLPGAASSWSASRRSAASTRSRSRRCATPWPCCSGSQSSSHSRGGGRSVSRAGACACSGSARSASRASTCWPTPGSRTRGRRARL